LTILHWRRQRIERPSRDLQSEATATTVAKSPRGKLISKKQIIMGHYHGRDRLRLRAKRRKQAWKKALAVTVAPIVPAPAAR
jgi:hypothetical protein